MVSTCHLKNRFFSEMYIYIRLKFWMKKEEYYILSGITKERSSFLLLKILVRKDETSCEWQRNRNLDNPPSFKTPSVPVIPIEIPRRKSICSISYGTRHHVKIIDVTDLIYRTSTVTALAETCLLNFEKADLWREREREEKNERKKRDKFQWNNFINSNIFKHFIVSTSRKDY